MGPSIFTAFSKVKESFSILLRFNCFSFVILSAGWIDPRMRRSPVIVTS